MANNLLWTLYPSMSKAIFTSTCLPGSVKENVKETEMVARLETDSPIITCRVTGTVSCLLFRTARRSEVEGDGASVALGFSALESGLLLWDSWDPKIAVWKSISRSDSKTWRVSKKETRPWLLDSKVSHPYGTLQPCRRRPPRAAGRSPPQSQPGSSTWQPQTPQSRLRCRRCEDRLVIHQPAARGDRRRR